MWMIETKKTKTRKHRTEIQKGEDGAKECPRLKSPWTNVRHFSVILETNNFILDEEVSSRGKISPQKVAKYD